MTTFRLPLLAAAAMLCVVGVYMNRRYLQRELLKESGGRRWDECRWVSLLGKIKKVGQSHPLFPSYQHAHLSLLNFIKTLRGINGIIIIIYMGEGAQIHRV